MMMIMTIFAVESGTGIGQALIPLAVFGGIVLGIMAILSMIAERNARSSERLMRHSRPASLAEIEDPKLTKKSERFQGNTQVLLFINPAELVGNGGRHFLRNYVHAGAQSMSGPQSAGY